MAQLNFPDSPTFGTVYAAPNGVNYTYTSINGLAVWTAVAGTPLTVTGGTIVGPAYSGNQLTYTPGVPAGGAAPYVITYQWLRNGVVIPSATALTYTLVPADVGTNITAKTNVTDASTQTASGTSNSIGPIAAAAAALTITSAGSIAPSSSVGVGDVLTYTTGTFTGGVPTVTQSWVWKRAGVAITGTADAPTYTTVTADAGQAITVTYTVTDSATPTANTANQTTTAVTPTTPFPAPDWNPTPSNGLDSNPGGQTGTYNGTGTSITTTGCVEASVNGGPYSTGTQAIVSGQSLATRWSSSGLCGGAASGTNITGSVSDGTYTNSYSLTLNREPSPAIADISDTNIALNATTTKGIASPVAGLNSPAYVTLGTGSTGTSIQVSTDNVTFVAAPTAPSTSFPIANAQTLYIRQTVGAAITTGYTAIVRVGDSDGVLADQVTYTATTVSSAVFPSTTFAPAGGPNASPANTLVGSLDGISTATWGAGSTNITATGSLEFQVNGGGFTQASTPVADTNTVELRWNAAAATAAADGGTLTGTLTNTTYTNTFSLTVDKQPTTYTWTDQTNVAASATVTSNVITIAGINCPAELTYTAGATNTLTSVQASIDGGAYVNIPTSSPGLTINPADAAGTAATTIQLRATVGAGVTTAYTLTTNIGKGAAVVTDEWSVTTTAVVASITTPSITSPANGTTNLNPATNSPAGIPLVGDAYAPLNGAGTPQTSSTWEVYGGSFPLTSTSAITATAQTAASWVGRTSGFAGSDIKGLTYGNSLYVAVGDGSILTTSPDGVTWTPQTSNYGGGDPIYRVTYGNSLYVAGGAGGKIITSSDGITWTLRSTGLGVGDDIYAMTYGNGLFVAGTTTAKVITSSNGTSWTTQTSGLAPGIFLFGATYSGSLYVLTGASGTIITSPDGITWTSRTSSFGTSLIYGVTYGNGLYVAVGDGGKLATSPDAITWTQQTSSFGTTPIQSVTYGNGGYVAAGNSGKLATSTDGITWTQQTSNFGTSGIVALTYGNSLYVAAGQAGKISTSSNAAGSTTLTIAGCQTDGFVVGDSVLSDPGAAASGTITSVNNTTVVVAPSSASWANGQSLKRNPTSYGAITGSPFTVSASPFTTLDVLQSALTTSSTYYARVKYATTNTTAATSDFSGWSSFGTSASFVPSPGDAFGGGYFGGQIRVFAGQDGGGLPAVDTIYNLIVAPVADGQYPGGGSGGTPTTVQYKTTQSANPNAAAANNKVYGLTPQNDALTNGTPADYPAFQWADALSIGGFIDWYLPAINELEILYYTLKPTTDGNSATAASATNPNAVPPRVGPYGGTPTASNPARTTSTLFQGTNSEAFKYQTGGSTQVFYWSATQNNSSTGTGLDKGFWYGSDGNDGKDSPNYARAIRRVAA